jgi:hypothetical protein
VVENVLPYLLSPDYVRPHVNEDGDDDDDAYSQAQDWYVDEDGDDVVTILKLKIGDDDNNHNCNQHHTVVY